MKTYFASVVVALAIVASFFIGRASATAHDSRYLAGSLIDAFAPTVSSCVDQKCVQVKNSCSADADCQTHMACNDQKQCVSVAGPGVNQCAADLDCQPIKNPQQWCEDHNKADGLHAKAEIFPGGNFDCYCYYSVSGIISGTPCKDSHSQ